MIDQQPSSLVLDTSVWINLLATQEFDRILVSLGAICIAPEQVLQEVIRDPHSKLVYSVANHPLRRHASVRIERLTAVELEIFLDLVGGPIADRLGDGEAAAIAIAATRNTTLVVDERKARRIIGERFSALRLQRSGDLICSDRVVRLLGAEAADDCRRKAIQFGRNHLPVSTLSS